MATFKSEKHPSLRVFYDGEHSVKFVDGYADATGKAADAVRGVDGVTERKGGTPAKPAADPDAPKSLDDMKVDELRGYAEEHGIDLGAASKKADIRAVIDEAEAAEQD